jgi:hypothetical protein
MAWYLVKQRDNFTFTYQLYRGNGVNEPNQRLAYVTNAITNEDTLQVLRHHLLNAMLPDVKQLMNSSSITDM